MNMAAVYSLIIAASTAVSVFMSNAVRLDVCRALFWSVIIYSVHTIKKPLTPFVYIAAVCMIFAVTNASFNDKKYDDFRQDYSGECIVTGRVCGFSEKENDNGVKRYAHIKAHIIGNKNGFKKLCGTFFKLELKDDIKEPAYGDIVTFAATPYYYEPPHNFGEFNYAGYMHSKGFVGIFSEPAKTAFRDGGFYPPKILYGLTSYLNNTIHKYIHGESAEFVCGILLGDRSGFSEKMTENIRLAGVSHITAVSGMHTAILAAFIIGFTNRFTKRRKTKALIASYILLIYMFMTGLSPSVVRASLMALCSMAGVLFGRRGNSFDVLIIIAAVMLSLNPELVFSPSFMLSFLATAGLLLFMPLLSGTKQNQLSKLLIMTLTANAFTLPYVLWNFGSFSVIGILVNLIVVPLLPYVFVGGMITALFGFLPPVGAAAGLFTETIVRVINGAISSAASGPGGQIYFSYKNFFFVIFWFLLLFLIYLGLKNMGEVSGKLFKVTAFLCVGTFLAGCLFNYISADNFSVTYLYVGHGDCALLNFPGGKKMLIDTGDVSGNTSRSEEFLKSYGIKKLDSVFISHSDSDHCGALENVLRECDVGTIYITAYSDINGISGDIQSLARHYDCPVKTLETGKIMRYNGAEIQIVYPESDYKDLSDNDSSMVMTVSFRGKKFVFTGDISSEIENALAERIGKCDVLKVSHHGSDTSTSKYFLETLKPGYAVVSASKPYSYKRDTIKDKLKESDIKAYFTYAHGAVKFTVFKNGKLKIKTKRREYINAEIE